MIKRTKRHLIRGLFFGLLFGLGLGLLAILYGFYFLGNMTPWIMVVIGLIVGILVAFVPRPWGRSAPPPVVTQ